MYFCIHIIVNLEFEDGSCFGFDVRTIGDLEIVCCKEENIIKPACYEFSDLQFRYGIRENNSRMNRMYTFFYRKKTSCALRQDRIKELHRTAVLNSYSRICRHQIHHCVVDCSLILSCIKAREVYFP